MPRQAGPTALKVVVAVVSVLVLLVSGTGWATIGRLGGDLASVGDLALGSGAKGFKQGQGADGAIDILLVGSDSRTDAQGNALSEAELAALHAGVSAGEENTDTIMVIRIPNDGSKATAISLPRDTYIKDAQFGNMKINGVFASHKGAKVDEMMAENEADRAEQQAAGHSDPKPKYTDAEIEAAGTQAGRAALLNEVHELSGVEIDHYAEVGLLGFVLLTEAVGGVDVCLNAPVDDEMSGAKFPAGRQTLQGAQALAFVRQRYELPRGDLDRIVRQQAFMASLVNKTLSSGTLTSPNKLNAIANAVERSVVIDKDWDIMGLATQMGNLAGGNVTFTTIPVTSIDGVGDYGESIVTIDPAQVHKFFEDLAKTEETSAAPAPETQSTDGPSAEPVDPNLGVHVLNAGTKAGLASTVSSWLTSEGYTVVETANAQPGIYDSSQIVAADPEDPRAKALSEKLGGLPITANAGLDAQTIIVVTGEEYSGPQDPAAANGDNATSTPGEQVGTPGADFGEAEVSPEINAGGDGPRCVN